MKTLVTSIILSITLSVSAQCPPFDLELTTQSEVDAFDVNFPNCTILTHSLSVNDIDQAIFDISHLSNIISAKQLIISNTSISNLNGLNNLVHADYLEINGNFLLQNINGLQNLTNIGFGGNQGGLLIENNFSLSSLHGLEHLKVIYGFLNVSTDNSANFSGLDSLHTVLGNIVITECSITSLQGLGSLSTVGGDITIQNNSSLQTLEGLDHLSTLFGGIDINHNQMLTSLGGLSHVDTIYNKVLLSYNSTLSDCSEYAICKFLMGYDPETDFASIFYNAVGCNNIEQIVTECMTPVTDPHQITARVQPNPTTGGITLVFDTDNNGTTNIQIVNTFGQLIKTYQLRSAAGTQYFDADLSGLPNGIYQIQIATANKSGTVKVVKNE